MLRGSATEMLVCEKLLELMQKKPYMEIKVTELVKSASVSRSAFYVYFNSIYDVIDKIEDDLIAGLPDESTIPISSIKEGNPDKLLSTLRYMKENMYIYRALVGTNGDPYFQIKMANRSTVFFERLLQDMDTHLSRTEIKLICENISGGRWQMYKWWAFHEDEISVEDMAKLTKRIFKQILTLF